MRSAVACAAASVGLTFAVASAADLPPSPPARYVGVVACAAGGCHAAEQQAWSVSQHQRAMAEASDSSVLGDFRDAVFEERGAATKFFRKGDAFFVRTEGADGKPGEFRIRYTFGFTPLQQYLVELPGGRLQAFGIAWDSRPEDQGGQRWFSLDPDRDRKAGSPLHWTGIEQNWNWQCADCHSTNLRKNYDAATDSYASTWSDISVSCEACHGPGSAHLDWAKQQKRASGQSGSAAEAPPGAALSTTTTGTSATSATGVDSGKGLRIALDERKGISWSIDASSGNALRSTPRSSDRELAVCARCHARRGQFSDDWMPGDDFADGYRRTLLAPGLYWPDGQMRDEVYNDGSFLQSRMHAKGVSCSDCHEPHTQKLRAPGSAVCAQCHSPARYAGAAHHHHAEGSKGSDCIACHMPVTTYMRIDARHDHSLRIPRPDRSVALGVPNACTACHADRSAEWAVAAQRQWFAQPKPGAQGFAEAFALADAQAPGAQKALGELLADAQLAGIVRASALERLASMPGAATLASLERATSDRDELVRAAAARALEAADAGQRAKALVPLLGDPRREVRMDAARSLAGDAEPLLSPADRERFVKALDEYAAGERFNADRPESRTNLGNLAAARGRADEAEAAYRSALALDPDFYQAGLNLADLYRATGREADAEKALREAVARDPGNADAHYALGLSLTRQKRSDEARREIDEALRLAPDDVHIGYAHALARSGAGDGPGAVAELESLVAKHPNDRQALSGLLQFRLAAGELAAARELALRLAALEPDEPQFAALVAKIDAASH